MDRCAEIPLDRYLIGTAGVVALLVIAVGLWTLPLFLEARRRVLQELEEERQMTWRVLARNEREAGRTSPRAPGMLSSLRFPGATSCAGSAEEDAAPPTLRSEDFRN